MRKRRGAISARLAESPMKRGELGRAEHVPDAAWRVYGGPLSHLTRRLSRRRDFVIYDWLFC